MPTWVVATLWILVTFFCPLLNCGNIKFPITQHCSWSTVVVCSITFFFPYRKLFFNLNRGCYKILLSFCSHYVCVCVWMCIFVLCYSVCHNDPSQWCPQNIHNLISYMLYEVQTRLELARLLSRRQCQRFFFIPSNITESIVYNTERLFFLYFTQILISFQVMPSLAYTLTARIRSFSSISCYFSNVCLS